MFTVCQNSFSGNFNGRSCYRYKNLKSFEKLAHARAFANKQFKTKSNRECFYIYKHKADSSWQQSGEMIQFLG